MKKIIFPLLFLSLFTTKAFALLAPLNQSIREFDAVITSKELPSYLDSNDLLIEIKRVGDTIIITTEQKQVIVDIIYSPTTRVGPKEFTLKFRETKK